MTKDPASEKVPKDRVLVEYAEGKHRTYDLYVESLSDEAGVIGVATEVDDAHARSDGG